ncbi:MAG: hypothetical protein M3Y72_05840 [Acidobacteriota bacterium]|nr:hypothetical protein [Acidobacteriota bacterium]
MMSDSLLAAIVTAVATSASTAGVAITALVLSNKRFDLTEKRFESIDKRFDLIEKRLDKIERTLELIQSDLKEFYKDITRLKAKVGLDQ